MRRLLLSRAGLARRVSWCALLLVVCAAHWWVARELPDSRFGTGADESGGASPPTIDVAFVRELAPTAPPVFVKPSSVSPRPAAVRAAEAPPSAASQPDAPASGPEEASAAASSPSIADRESMSADAASAAASSASSTADVAVAAIPVAQAGTAVSAPAPAASSVVAFDWPPSTRLSYDLVGDYRGPLNGTAKVEWLRDGSHYQVRLEVSVALVVSRRMLSDGQLGPQGLQPRRYDEETEIPFRDTRRLTVRFEPDAIHLSNGKVNDPVPGVQDTASQFVQMTWMFLTRPELLKVGQSVEFPLALPRRVGQWTYDIVEQVPLWLPFGEVQAFHLAPRPGTRRPNELTVEMWIAPSLQYLPVKISIRQDEQSYVELSLKSRPLQADAGRPGERIVR